MSLKPRLLALLLSPLALAAQPDWIQHSNAYAEPVLDAFVQFTPEQGSAAGQAKFDTQVVDLQPKRFEREQASLRATLAKLKDERATEMDAHVQQDLDIMIDRVGETIDSNQLAHDTLLPFDNISQTVYAGLDSLLDPRNKPERQAQALIRLKRYAGLEAGYTPVAQLAREREMEELSRPGLVGPYAEDVKQQLDNTEFYLKGIKDLFVKAKLKGWEGPYEKLAKQLREQDAWSRVNVLPRARSDARQPPAIYADALKQMGVDIGPDELIERATADYMEVRDQMQVLATRIAADQHLPSSDYRDVLRYYKRNTLEPTAMLSLYWKRLHEIEAIIRREHLITLPDRQANIRLATEAESAQTPAPQMRPPRLIGNTGEYGEFLIPIGNPHAKSTARFDDFTNDAVAWTLAAHEARPGHELQFASMVEQGTSLPRALFAENSANVEGWALYCEAMMLPYMPPEGQLFSLQGRLQRMARAFLDPMVNLGRITPEEAKRFLMEEVTLSEPMAQQEADRYAFTSPGQATSYYYGYLNMRGLRTQTELALGKHFNLQAFNDFVIQQGLLPPKLLKQAVLNDFVPSQLGEAKLATSK